MDHSKKTNIALTIGIISGIMVILVGSVTLWDRVKNKKIVKNLKTEVS